MVQIARRINYEATFMKILKEYWDEMLLLLGFLLIITYLSSTGATDIARQGILGMLGWIGGSALLGYILISVGGALMIIPAGWTQIAGVIMIAIGWVMAGASILTLWSWIKSNLLLFGALFAGVIVIWYRMRAPKRPVQNIYYVQSPQRKQL